MTQSKKNLTLLLTKVVHIHIQDTGGSRKERKDRDSLLRSTNRFLTVLEVDVVVSHN